MLKPIFYKHIPDGWCYKLQIMTTNQDYIDLMLDALKPSETEYITEQEFNSKYEKYMTLDVKTEEGEKIAELTNQFFDEEVLEEYGRLGFEVQ